MTIEEFFAAAGNVRLSQSERENGRIHILSAAKQNNNVRAETESRHSRSMKYSPETFLATARECAMTEEEKMAIRRAVLQDAHALRREGDDEEESMIESFLSWFRMMHRMFGMRGLSAAMAGILLITSGGGLAFAAEGSLPGDALYALKVKVTEPLVSTILVRTKAKAEWEVRRTERRLEEADQLAQEGRMTIAHAQTIAKEMEQHAQDAQTISRKVEQNDINEALAITKRLEQVLSQHEKRILRQNTMVASNLLPAVERQKSDVQALIREEQESSIIAAATARDNTSREAARQEHVRNEERDRNRAENEESEQPEPIIISFRPGTPSIDNSSAPEHTSLSSAALLSKENNPLVSSSTSSSSPTSPTLPQPPVIAFSQPRPQSSVSSASTSQSSSSSFVYSFPSSTPAVSSSSSSSKPSTIAWWTPVRSFSSSPSSSSSSSSSAPALIAFEKAEPRRASSSPEAEDVVRAAPVTKETPQTSPSSPAKALPTTNTTKTTERAGSDFNLDGIINETDLQIERMGSTASMEEKTLSATSGMQKAAIAQEDTNTSPVGAVILDNNDALFRAVGPWERNTDGGFRGSYLEATEGSNFCSAQWEIHVTPGTEYEVAVTWSSSVMGAEDAPFFLNTNGDDEILFVNQSFAPGHFSYAGTMWHRLATFTAVQETITIELINYADGPVFADAVLVREVLY